MKDLPAVQSGDTIWIPADTLSVQGRWSEGRWGVVKVCVCARGRGLARNARK